MRSWSTRSVSGQGNHRRFECQAAFRGERQGVAIGRAMYFEAELLILDEPTVALSLKEDAEGHQLCGNQGSRRAARACIYISHDIRRVTKSRIASSSWISRGDRGRDCQEQNITLKSLDEFLLNLSMELRDKAES